MNFAWDAFAEKNGASSLEAMRERIGRLRREGPTSREDYTIGCIILVEPFFWSARDWIPQPRDWKGPTQRGKGMILHRALG